MNTFYEPYYITAQGQPERTTLYQHIKPQHKAGREKKCLSTAITARKKLCISIKSRKHILTNHKVGKS